MKKTLILSAVIAGIATTAFAHGKASGIVRERMDSMVILADTMKALGAAAKSSEPLDEAVISGASLALIEHSGTNLTSLFPEGSTQHSDATQAVWTDTTNFQRLADELFQLGTELSGVADKPELVVRIKKIGQTCSACHQTYRQKTE